MEWGGPPLKSHWGPHEKTAGGDGDTQLLEGAQSCLIPDFPNRETIRFCRFKTPSVWHFVVVALAN